jgi:hypothetical protein
MLGYVVIEAGTLWLEYSKSYFFCSALRAADQHGARITHQEVFRNREEALGFAVRVARPDVRQTSNFSFRQHPDWRSPGVIRKLLRTMRASSVGAWELGMGVQSRVTADLPTMRNFFAHKNREASDRARALRRHYGLTQNLSPWELLSAVPPQSQQPLVREWLDDLSAMIRLTAV